MTSFLVCPLRKNSKVSMEICIKKCESKDECDEYREAPREDLHAVMKKLGVSIPEETEPMIEAEVVEEQAEIENPENPPEEQTTMPAVATAEKPPSNGEAMRLYDRILYIRTEIEIRFFEMGLMLAQIFANRFYLEYGYKDRRSFCAGVLGMSLRTATYLRDISVKMVELGIQEQECAQIGWSKLKEVLPVINKKNARYWIAEAKKKGMTTEALNAKVRLARGKITEEEAGKLLTKMFFSFYEEQIENVERALEIAQRMTASTVRSHNLEMIAVEFRSTYEANDGEYTKAKIVSGLIERIETVMNVKVGDVVDTDTGEILIHG